MSELEINFQAPTESLGFTPVFVDVRDPKTGDRWQAQFNFGPKTEIVKRTLMAHAYRIDGLPHSLAIQVLRQNGGKQFGDKVLSEQVVFRTPEFPPFGTEGPKAVWEERNRLRTLVKKFADGDPCRYDHDKQCQTHTLHEKPCPWEEANEIASSK